MIQDYKSKVESEGELTEEELPEEMLDQVEDNCSIDRKHFAVSIPKKTCGQGTKLALCPRSFLPC
jgi:hypothetical protein